MDFHSIISLKNFSIRLKQVKEKRKIKFTLAVNPSFIT